MGIRQILVCGGCGYIGSHLVRELTKLPERYEIVVLDNLSTGHTAAVPKSVTVAVCDIRDQAAVEAVLKKHKPDAVMVSFCQLAATQVRSVSTVISHIAFLCVNLGRRICPGSTDVLRQQCFWDADASQGNGETRHQGVWIGLLQNNPKANVSSPVFYLFIDCGRLWNA